MVISTRRLLQVFALIGVVCLAHVSVEVVEARNRAIALRSGIWQTRTILVCWENPTEANRQGRDWVQEAVTETWQKHSQLRFIGWNACGEDSQGIRIYIEETWPHVKGLGKHLNGIPRGMVLNFTFQNWSSSQCRQRKEFCTKALAVHDEFGHALGFAHEHNREEASPACQKEAQGASGDFKITAYDLYSVMNYCNPKWIGNGKLSALDIVGLQTLYGAPQPERLVGLSGALHFQLASGAMRADLQGSLYTMTRPYPSGTLFQVFIINHQPAYVYTFGFDRLEKTYRIFPRSAAHSAYVDQTRPQLVIPDEAHYVSIDDTVGTDYFCVLFSHQQLDFATVLQRLEEASGSFFTRLHTVVGAELVLESHIQYAEAGDIGFTATRQERGIVPLIVAIEHTP